MYRVYSDSYLIHSDAIESLKIRIPQLEMELNKTGSFVFDIYPDHPYYSMIQKLKSVITVYQDDDVIFRGRCLNDELGFHDEKQVVCEGQLAFLLDSIQRPFDYSGTVSGFFSALISNHNDQVEEEHRFTVGNVTVTDSEPFMRSSVEYVNTWDAINKELIEKLGGYIFTREESGVHYIDYVSDFSVLSSQTIKFAKNLLEMKRIRKGEDIATALIPLGAKVTDSEGNETDERLTIKTVNNDVDFIYNQTAVNSYGWIFQAAVFDDIVTASDLLTAGQTHLAGLIAPDNSIELSAADLASIDDVASFHLGTYVKVESSPHGINQNFLINKLSINLLDPASNKITLGGAVQDFTESAYKTKTEQNQLITVIENAKRETSESIHLLEKNTSSSITQSEESIMSIVNEIFYLKDEEDSIVSSVSTELEQTKEDIEIRFNSFNASLEDMASGTDTEFEEIRKYIRFVDGKIILGEAGNELELQIANDRISFLQNGAEVAYFSDRKLYVTDGEYTNSLRLGSFAFLPRANGNLSFKKMN